MKKLNKKGFTIVELVIVIAVIAILAAVLIPTFAGVVADAQKTAIAQEAANVYKQYAFNVAKTGDVEDEVYIILNEGKDDEIVVRVAQGVYQETTNLPECNKVVDEAYNVYVKLANAHNNVTEGEGESAVTKCSICGK